MKRGFYTIHHQDWARLKTGLEKAVTKNADELYSDCVQFRESHDYLGTKLWFTAQGGLHETLH
ncbi:MAG: hypothetical protein GX117_05990 [Candidatus Hydrogenedentes bacterium]|nr:hypothetical protein [Candidatus Hydrogenedentota bacterium]